MFPTRIAVWRTGVVVVVPALLAGSLSVPSAAAAPPENAIQRSETATERAAAKNSAVYRNRATGRVFRTEPSRPGQWHAPRPDDRGRPAPARTRAQQPPALTLQTQPRIDARRGGRGIAQVVVSRRKQAGVTTRHLELRVAGPRGTRVAGTRTVPDDTPRTRGTWNCRADGRGRVCTTDRRYRSGQIPPVLRVWLRADDRFPRSSARIRSHLRWTEQKVRAGQSGFEPRPTVVGSRRQELTDSARLTVERSVRVRVQGLNGNRVHVLVGGTARERRGSLIARLRNVGRHRATVRWSQVAGPRVRLQQRSTATSAATTRTRFVVPSRVRDGARLRFRATVVTNGQAATAHRTLRVVRHERGRFAARKATMKRAVGQSRRAARLERRGLRVAGDVYQASVRGAGTRSVEAGQPVSLRFRSSRELRRVQWRGVGRSLPAHSSVGATLRFRAPKQPQVFLVRGIATLRSGARMPRTTIVRVLPVRTPGRGGASPGGSSQSTGFCGQSGPVTLTLGSAVLAIRQLNPPTPCTAATPIPFAQARLTVDGVPAVVSGTLTSTQVVVQRASFAAPAAWQPYLPQTLQRITAGGGGGAGLVASRTAGAWSGLTGELSGATVPRFLPALGGWKVTATVSVTDGTGAPGLTVNVSGAAGNNSGGQFLIQAGAAAPQSLTVSAATLAVLRATDGDQLDFSVPTATVPLSGTPSVTIAGFCPDATPGGACPLAPTLAIADGTAVTWGPSGVTLPVTSIAVAAATPLTLSVAGTYRAPGNWQLAVAQAADWPLADGVAFTGLDGTIGETPSSGGFDFQVDVSGSVTGLSVDSAIEVSQATASITNRCATGAAACSQRAVRVSATVSGNAQVLGDQIPFAAAAQVDPATMDLQFNARIAVPGSVGPASLDIDAVTLILSDEQAVGGCAANGQPAPSSGALSLALTASGSAFGESVTISGDVNADGYCLWSDLGTWQQGGFQGSAVVLGYSSYGQGARLTLPAGKGRPATVLAIAPGDIALTGQTQLPAAVTSELGLPPGTVRFDAVADLDTAGFTAQARYSPDQPALIAGGANSLGVTLSAASLRIAVRAGADPSAALTLAASGNLISSADGSPCPLQPGPTPGCDYGVLSGSIGVVAGTQGLGLTVDLGVSGAGPCPGGAPGRCLDDLFGQQGLAVADLGVSATASVPGGLSLAFNADAFLPPSWVSDIALVNDPEVDLSFDLSDTTPCVAFSVGQENSGQTYLDVADAGVVQASFAAFVVAPAGCTLPTASGPEPVPPGYAIAFDGQVLGAQVDTSLTLQLSGAGMVIDDTMQISSFELLSAVMVDNTVLDFDVDTATDTFDVAVAGGFDLGAPALVDADVSISGYLDSQGPGDYALVLDGSAAISAFGFDGSLTSGACPTWAVGLAPTFAGQTFPVTDCLIAVQVQGGVPVDVDVAGQFSLEVFDQTVSGQVDLVYSDQQLQELAAALGITLGWRDLSIGGTVWIDYCVGSLNTGSGPTGPDSCALGGDDATFYIYAQASADVLWWTVTVGDTFADQTFPV